VVDSRKVSSSLAVAILTRPLRTEEVHSITGSVIAMGVVVALLYWARVLLITAMVAVTIAFLLEPFVGLLMRLRLPRAVASFLVCTGALMLLYLAGLGAYTQVARLWDDLPNFSQHIGDAVESFRLKLDDMEKRTYQLVVPARQREAPPPPPVATTPSSRKKKNVELPAPPVLLPMGTIQEVRIHEERKPFSDYLYSELSSLYQIILMVSFVPFLVYFMLSWRDHIHRSFLQFFEGEDRMAAARSLQGIGEMLRGFVVGNFVLGIFLAVMSTLAFWGLHLDYPILAGPVSGFLSLVPYIGMPLALIPPLFVGVAGGKSISSLLLVGAVVMLFHLLALNFLYPKIVGSRVHLNPLAVTFALMIWGFLWDAPGLLLAIPLTAAIKAVCDNVKGLRPYGKFLGD
jgi:predicted PurR-regulated permease PerM